MARIRAVYTALEEIGKEVVFVGGATVSLYANRPATETRPTEDVDILVELTGYAGYAEIEDKLRRKGFANDIESGVICRYRVQGIIVDVMPTDESILGFSNRWYQDGYANAVTAEAGEGYEVKVFQAPYFIASKLEAFLNRGQGDGRMSTDFEDIVFVLNSRTVIWDEMNAAEPGLKTYLQIQFSQLLSTGHLYEWISAHLEYIEQRRAAIIFGGLQAFVDNFERV